MATFVVCRESLGKVRVLSFSCCWKLLYFSAIVVLVAAVFEVSFYGHVTLSGGDVAVAMSLLLCTLYC